MTELKALELGVDQNLADFCQYLWQMGIPNRVFESEGRQIMVVSDPEHVAIVRQAYEALSEGRLQLKRVAGESTLPARPTVLSDWPRFRMTVFLILLSFLGAVLVYFDHQGQFVSLLAFQDFSFNLQAHSVVFSSPMDSLLQGQFWRLVTPIFLHFGPMHVIFNCLWLLELGRRIEVAQGHWRLLGIVLLVGAGSNLAQYLDKPDILFGGMSGVIYGLLGYCWMWNRFSRAFVFNLPPGVVGFMLVWLVICMTDVLSVAGIHVANSAHLSGLIIGMLVGSIAALVGNQQTGRH